RCPFQLRQRFLSNNPLLIVHLSPDAGAGFSQTMSDLCPRTLNLKESHEKTCSTICTTVSETVSQTHSEDGRHDPRVTRCDVREESTTHHLAFSSTRTSRSDVFTAHRSHTQPSRIRTPVVLGQWLRSTGAVQGDSGSTNYRAKINHNNQE